MRSSSSIVRVIGAVGVVGEEAGAEMRGVGI